MGSPVGHCPVCAARMVHSQACSKGVPLVPGRTALGRQPPNNALDIERTSMPAITDSIKARFAELAAQATRIPLKGDQDDPYANGPEFHAWANSALNLVLGVFGKDSPHYQRLSEHVTEASRTYVALRALDACRGSFLGAKSDADGDYIFRLETQFTGEVFGNLVTAAKAAQAEGHHEVAAVLASAALEDALKRFAAANQIATDGKTMEEVVNALKSKGLVGGAQKTLLSAMPKIRNQAMHADWQNLTPQEVGSLVGFTEQFLLSHF